MTGATQGQGHREAVLERRWLLWETNPHPPGLQCGCWVWGPLHLTPTGRCDSLHGPPSILPLLGLDSVERRALAWWAGVTMGFGGTHSGARLTSQDGLHLLLDCVAPLASQHLGRYKGFGSVEWMLKGGQFAPLWRLQSPLCLPPPRVTFTHVSPRPWGLLAQTLRAGMEKPAGRAWAGTLSRGSSSGQKYQPRKAPFEAQSVSDTKEPGAWSHVAAWVRGLLRRQPHSQLLTPRDGGPCSIFGDKTLDHCFPFEQRPLFLLQGRGAWF